MTADCAWLIFILLLAEVEDEELLLLLLAAAAEEEEDDDDLVPFLDFLTFSSREEDVMDRRAESDVSLRSDVFCVLM